ncbi:uncharacterized protein LOC144642686 [Oculina patagonica]
MWMLTFLLLFVVQSGLAAQCDRDVGPVGLSECVSLQNYDQYQWATCLTNDYIQQKSGHKHICFDRSATYCWYQCMIEVHDKESGSVLEDCSCHPDGVYTTQLPLPQECYSPPGNFCNWYRDCLELKYPCEATSNAYAIKYAEKFCKLYGERYSLFSEDGQKWVDGVRKCLQVTLTPLLRRWEYPSCEALRTKAFDSHEPCYLDPDKDVPSICDLDYSQFLKIFWTIKGDFVKLDTAGKTLQGLLVTGTNCTVRYAKQTYNEVTRFIKLKIKNFFQRNRRSTDSLPEADVQSRFADGVGSEIASALKWNTDVMDWFAYPERLDGIEYLDIVLVLADKKALGINTTSTPSVNLNRTIQDFASAVEKGTLYLQVDGYNVWIKSLASCTDKFCDSTQTLAVSDNPPKRPLTVSEKPSNWNGAANIAHGSGALCGVIAVFIILTDKLLF